MALQEPSDIDGLLSQLLDLNASRRTDPERELTLGAVEARQRVISQRGELIQQLLAVHEREHARLQLLRGTVRNYSTPIGGMPDEILLMIFSMAQSLEGSNYRFGSVCRQWRDVTHGPVGSKLWSQPSVRINSRASIIPQSKILSHGLSLSAPHPIHLSLQSGTNDVSSDETELVLSVALPTARRWHGLSIQPFECFKSWFPLSQDTTSLRTIDIRGPGWKETEAMLSSPILSTPAPFLRSFEITLTTSISPRLSSVLLLNIAAFGAVTHLNIQVGDAVREVFEALHSFRGLESLQWRYFGTNRPSSLNDTEGNPPRPLHLLKLKKLVVAGTPAMMALHTLDAPLLESLDMSELDVTKASEGTQDFYLVYPAKFPLLKFLRCSQETWPVGRVVEVMTSHEELHVIVWTIHIERFASLVQQIGRSLSRIAEQPSHVDGSLLPFQNLNTIYLTCREPFPFDICRYGYDTMIVQALESLVLRMSAISSYGSFSFVLLLSEDLVRASQAIKKLVEENDMISSFTRDHFEEEIC
ncbi:hypothetical protein DL93DRAFT_2166583 [Clavulina sp. PMI_390]|nr:hypothetical protein DL93DRAFT_2166583 [Clavulina sp. PMI_390]